MGKGKGEATREAIIASALDVFSENDFHRATVRTIAKHARVGVGTIYRYFPNKETLIFSILENGANALAAKIGKAIDGTGSTHIGIQKAIWTTLDFLQKNTRLGTLIYIVVPLKSWMSNPVFAESKWNQIFIHIFKEGQKRGDLRSDMDVIAMMDVAYALVQRQFQMQQLRKSPRKLTSIANQISDIIYNAFKKEAEKGSCFA